MDKPLHSVDPGHEAKRARLSKLGLILLGIGIPCGVLGLGLFLSFFFAVAKGFSGGVPDMGPVVIRMVGGLVLIGFGGFASMIGLQMFGFAHTGALARYQAGEVLPVATDAAHQIAPTGQEIARGMARSARQGWEEGAGLTHACPSCGSVNPPTSRFCNQCGAQVGA